MDIFTFSGDSSFFLLFLISFLAATLVPLGSEWLVVVMVTKGFPLETTVATASIGNYLGGCTTFAIGVLGTELVFTRLLRMDQAELMRAKRLYLKYGTWTLLLSWLPVVGDALCLVAGVFKTGFIRFSLLVFTGKLARYSIVAILAKKAVEQLS
ncbi:membrane protein YqaA, SNARE-associated domain [Desulforhopalus singaporensis]|uniref:Membrane protein YqaA, SNARE-associated domain n=2 Tax=Desulforhopalus singaporensis TaxID=91360 RepID=A0A1H0KRP2_9BACT|nr:membrane protein YqaA, SNARE-associated domain [Desulforhopalus singaporensis]